jgi:hypothetical protein
MFVFDYMIRLYNQDVSVRVAPVAAESATDRRGSAAKLAVADSAAGSAHS